MGLRRGRLKASTLVLVLIVIAVVAAVLVYMLSRIQVQIQQQVLEKATTRSEQQALSALDRLTKEVIEKPDEYKDKKEVAMSQAGLNICSEDAVNEEERCGNESKVELSRYSEVVQYYMKNDETIQINIAEKPNSGPVGISVFTGSPKVVGGVGDTLLVMGYKYSPEGLKMIGQCVLDYKGRKASCLGNLKIKDRYNNHIANTEDVLDKNAVAKYGETLIEVVPDSSVHEKVSFYRIKALLADINSTWPVSVAGEINNGEVSLLPESQVMVMTARVYSADKTNRQTYTEYTRMVWLHPAMPEVFDWVLFNDSNKPIKK